MNKNIFYSWQSDLPNNTNRSFIEASLELAIAQLKSEDIHLEVAIDRDTKGSSGTPEIVNTLFSKIDKCHVFVADVSLINQDGKRTPNPNVLLELGYAVKCVGWDNIICAFNTAYGRPEELPFDLRFRSPLQYHLHTDDPKADNRRKLAASLHKSLTTILTKQTSRDRIYSNIKVQVDHHLMAIANIFYKLFYGYKDFVNPHDLFALIDLPQEELSKVTESKIFLGFQLFKNTEKLQDSFQAIINNPIFAKYIDEDRVASLITLIDELYIFNENMKHRKNFFIETGDCTDEYVDIQGQKINPANPDDRFLLFKKAKDNYGIVTDSGDFDKYREKDLLKYFKLQPDERFTFHLLYKSIFKAVEKVIAAWDGSIMLNPAKIE